MQWWTLWRRVRSGVVWLSAVCLTLAPASTTFGQVVISNRPFGVDVGTWHPHADGFFDSSIGEQLIGVYLLNQGTQTISGASAIASFAPGSGITLTQPVAHLGDLVPGIPTLGFFKADFGAASPDKHALNLNVNGNGGSFSQATSRNLFVMRDVHDPVDVNRWTVFAPEGSITTQVLGHFGGHNPGSITALTGYDWTVQHNVPFSGQYSALPYDDPFWKAFGLGFAIGGSIGWVAGAIVEACGNEKYGKLISNVGQAEKAIGGIGTAADFADPFRRGQENTVPLPNEKTLRETVHLTANYLGEPLLGTPWSANVAWDYQRITDGNVYSYSVVETQQNIHYTTSRSLTINKTTLLPGEELVLTAHATGPQPLVGDRAIFVANLLPADDGSYDNIVRSLVMRDDGQHGDLAPGDGIYTGVTSTTGLPAGVPLAAYVFGFDINNAAVTDPPLVAAQEIGGLMISTPQFGDCAIQPDFLLNVAGVGTFISNWNVDASGDWSNAANWTGAAVPNGVDHVANFGPIITAPRTVLVDASQWAGAINFASPISYDIAGSSPLTLDTTTGPAFINVNGGSHTISAPIILNDDTTIMTLPGTSLTLTGSLKATGRNITKLGPGVVQFENVRAAGLDIIGGIARVREKGTANSAAGTSVLKTLAISAGASLDLTDNSMAIDYAGPGPNAALSDQVRMWLMTGTVLTTASTPAGATLGYADNAALSAPFTTFGGVSVDAGSLLIKYTYRGDCNLDGQVDISDLGILATNWQSASPWTGGDSNYDGVVDITDLGMLATNWQAGVGNPLGPSIDDALSAFGLPAAGVPEPAVGWLAWMAAGPLVRRRSR